MRSSVRVAAALLCVCFYAATHAQSTRIDPWDWKEYAIGNVRFEQIK